MKGLHPVRLLTTSVVVAIFTSTLPAQVPVKKDLLLLVGQVPPPPASVRDAYAKTASSQEDLAPRCNADKVFESIDRETGSLEAAFKAQGREAAIATSGMTPDMVKKAQDPELKKRMKKMTKEERMKLAMEMMNSGEVPQPAVMVDSPPIRAALDEWQKVNARFPDEFKSSEPAIQEGMRIQQEYEKGHAEISDRERAEIAALPQISSGEMSAPDPAQLKAVQLRAADRHIAHANLRLGAIRSEWNTRAKATTDRYAAFHEKLVTANYGLDSGNPSTKKILADAQLMILKDIGRLVSQSRAAYEESAQWMARRVEIERQ
jgi:hypothetical protein